MTDETTERPTTDETPAGHRPLMLPTTNAVLVRGEHNRQVMDAIEDLGAALQPLIAELHRELDRQLQAGLHRIIDAALILDEDGQPSRPSIVQLVHEYLPAALMRTRWWAEREAQAEALERFCARVAESRRSARSALGLATEDDD